MPNPFNYSNDTRAQELMQFLNLKGIPMAPQLLQAVLGSIGGGSQGFNTPYSSIGRGMYANRTANLAEKLYIDPFAGAQSLQSQDQTFRDNTFASKWLLPFYKTSLGVRDPRVQQALGLTKELDQGVQMLTGQSFMGAMSGNFSSSAVAQNLASASYANFYGSGAAAAKLAKADLKFMRDQLYARSEFGANDETGMRTLLPDISDMSKTGGLGRDDLTSLYNTLKQENIIKGSLQDNMGSLKGFGGAITAARNVFGEDTGTTELLRMFQEMHGDLANVNPEQIKSTMTKLTAILDVTQKGAQELIARTENIRMTAAQYGGHMDVERGLEITTNAIFREAELKGKGYSGRRANDIATDEATQLARASVSSKAIKLSVLTEMGINPETLKKIAQDDAAYLQLDSNTRQQAEIVTNSLIRGGAVAQERYMSSMTADQKAAVLAATRSGLSNAGGSSFGSKLDISTDLGIALANKLKDSEAFTKELNGLEFSNQIDADVRAFVKDNPAAAPLLGKLAIIRGAIKAGDTTDVGSAYIAAAFANSASTGGPLADGVGSAALRAEEDLDAQMGKFWQKDSAGKYLLDKSGNKIEDEATKKKVEATTQMLWSGGMDPKQAKKLAREKSDPTVVGIAATLQIARASGNEKQLADAKRWAALKLGEHWGASISADKVLDTLSYVMPGIKDATDQAPDYMLTEDKKINLKNMKTDTESLENRAKQTAKLGPMAIPVSLQFGDNGVIQAMAKMVSEHRQSKG